MPRVYVQFAGMKQLGESWDSIGSKIDDISRDFKETVQNLDWDIKCQENINHTASSLASNLNGYRQALKEYQIFFQQAYDAYVKLDAGKNDNGEISNSEYSKSDFTLGINLGTILAGSNYIKSIYDITNGVNNAQSWLDYLLQGEKARDFLTKVIKDVKNYTKIGRAVGGKTATSWFFKNAVGLKKIGYISQADNVWTRFANNLTNKTSPFRKQFVDAVDDFAGKNGIKKAIPAWLSVAATGISNWASNKEEQAASGGTMTDARVMSETIMETAIDTVASWGAKALIGAAVAAVGGSVAPPVIVVTAASTLAIAGINAGVKAITGKTATEWVSDAVLDTGDAIVKGVGSAAKAVSNAISGWFGKAFA